MCIPISSDVLHVFDRSTIFQSFRDILAGRMAKLINHGTFSPDVSVALVYIPSFIIYCLTSDDLGNKQGS